MRHKYGITYKITILLLVMAAVSLLLTGSISAWSLITMRTISAENGRRLGKTAAADEKAALENMAGEQLLHTATVRALYIDEKYRAVEACVRGITAQAKHIYQNRESYPDREVPLPVKGSTELAPQLLHSEKLTKPTPEQQKEILKLGNLQDLLVQYNANNDMISSTYLATVSGWLIQADYIAYSKYRQETVQPADYEAAERQWYQRAVEAEENEIIYTDVIRDVHQDKDCMVCAAPVFVNGKVVAVAGVGSYLDTVREDVLQTTIGENGYAFLIGRKGQVVVSPRASGETAVCTDSLADLREGENTGLAYAVSNVLNGESGLQKLTIDDKEVYLAYAPLERLGGGFLTVMDVEEVMSPAVEGEKRILALSDRVADRQNDSIQKTFHLFSAALIVIVAVVILSGMALGRKLTAPIRRLTEDVAKIDGGNLGYRICVTTGDEIEELGTAFNHMTAQLQRYVDNLAVMTAEKERIRAELEFAARLQLDMLPEGENAFPGRDEFTLYASIASAKGVGGDFYDFFLTDEYHLALVVADVSGKGVPAALFMVVAKTLLRSHIMAQPTLAKAVEETNECLCDNNQNGMFVTAWIGILDTRDGMLTYVNAGHCRPLVRWAGGACHYLKEQGGFVLGGVKNIHYKESSVRLLQGDMLLQYSDGVTEMHDTEENLYGEERLKNLLNTGEAKEPKQLIAAVWKDIRRFQGAAEQFDDITMLAIRYNGDMRTMTITEPDLQSLPAVVEFVEEYMKQHNFPQREMIKILVAVDEIYSNICRYSQATESAVSCFVSGSRAKITFTDNGIPYNPLEAPEPDITADTEERPIGGLGVYMVKKTMDSVTYEYEAKKNKLCIMK